MKLNQLIGFAFAVFLPVVAQAKMVAEVNVADEVTFADHSLLLNGAGIRSKFFMDLYVGSLYLPARAQELDAVLELPIAVIQLTITSSMITSDKMRTAIEEGFDSATDNNIGSIKKDIEHFTQLFADEIVEGDQFTFITQKGKGVTSLKNGRVQGDIAGEAFRQALLKIWLGDNPAQDSLKQDMLAQ
ncbi:chalcone isomerase family protein [Shewanella inventionis]|uniref:Chalcone isomerase n=1 Tax=Shewanella inventionis TaxID=1738770 RepID=A0ABQ1ITK8_9GAMM|nr:chalcone isomerase family protein [Shewanella inventionis]MCL1156702.1 chalcone isomerase family protein [Shewanella inventionis]UAL44914.1 chalcone isomerase family protein [Shewanella inventionis]GGB50294.1 chalcone isomerase [Shewanella inventionis]